jgi:hypothetical protein
VQGVRRGTSIEQGLGDLTKGGGKLIRQGSTFVNGGASDAPSRRRRAHRRRWLARILNGFFFVDGAERSALLDSAAHAQFQAGDEGRSALNEKQRGLRDPVRTPDCPSKDVDGRALYYRQGRAFFRGKINAPSP